MEWIQGRPKLFLQGKWGWPRDKEISTIPKSMSILSGPESPLHPARAFLKSVFPPFDPTVVATFMTRFRTQISNFRTKKVR